VKIVTASTVADIEVVRTLFREYAASLSFDLCFQGFDEELRSLPGKYAAPLGRLLLAVADDDMPVGCVGLRQLDSGIAEMKRLFVRPSFRGQGIGKNLVLAVLDEAQAIGYRTVRLDTLASMKDANRLYEILGFQKIRPYCVNPLPGAKFFEKSLNH